ncbi:MAG: endonuclease/exonuclease/phosphatase family protein [Chloroflexota bacterium]
MDHDDTRETFSLLSLNTFGLPFYIASRRLGRLARVLKKHPVDMICFQEIQQNHYVPTVMRELREHYPFWTFETKVWAPKGGLLTLSKSMYETSHFIPYSERGKLFSLGFGDWALHKGMLRTQFQVGQHPVVVMNTHVQANYLAKWSPSNNQARIQSKQMEHLAQQVQAEAPEALVIVCGDFNFPRHAYLYEELMSQSGLVDVFADDPRPTYMPFPMAPAGWKTTLDYMLIRQPANSQLKFDQDILCLEHTEGRWNHQRFLSDHCALKLQVTWEN